MLSNLSVSRGDEDDEVIAVVLLAEVILLPINPIQPITKDNS
jgi:hypothetical protein